MSTLAELLTKHKLTGPVRKEITVEPKILDAKAGIVRFVASDETLDCYNEIVRLAGWRFTHFAKNAPFVNSHRYCSISDLLGKVLAYNVTGSELVEDVQFALTERGDTLADWAFKLYRDGFLRACSVGFVPVRMASKWDADKTAFLSQIADLKLDAMTAAKVAAIYFEQEQIELSGCIIGANPNALAKSLTTIASAYRAGCLTESDVQKFSAVIAASKNANPANDSADAGAAHTRTRLAILSEIQARLHS